MRVILCPHRHSETCMLKMKGQNRQHILTDMVFQIQAHLSPSPSSASYQQCYLWVRWLTGREDGVKSGGQEWQKETTNLTRRIPLIFRLLPSLISPREISRCVIYLARWVGLYSPLLKEILCSKTLPRFWTGRPGQWPLVLFIFYPSLTFYLRTILMPDSSILPHIFQLLFSQ